MDLSGSSQGSILSFLERDETRGSAEGEQIS